MGNCFEDIMAFALLPSITDLLLAYIYIYAVVRAKPKHSTAPIILWSVGVCGGVCGGYWLSSVYKSAIFSTR